MIDRANNKTTEQIWRGLGDQLRRFIRSRVRQDADAEDVLQEVFLKIHRNIGKVRETQRLEAWVFQIARNAVNDFYRQEAKRVGEGELPLPGEPHDDLEPYVQELGKCVAAMVSELPGEQGRAVGMYELEGLPQQEIADREGISLSGAKSRIQRGREKLKGMILECCDLKFDSRGNLLGREECRSDCGCEETDHRSGGL